MCNDDHIKPFGSALEHGKEHEKSHSKWSRRAFLTSMGLASSGAAFLGKLPLTASPLVAALSGSESDRILVLVHLKGGNDGLNTIVPVYDYGTYQSLRPNIHIPQADLFTLNDSVSVPNYMVNAAALYNEDKMKVVQGVGYDGQNLSHFRSTDIWSAASDPDEVPGTGWLGRYADSVFPDLIDNPPAVPPAVQIGSAGNITFQGSSVNVAVSMANTNRLEQVIENGQLYPLDNLPDDCYGEELGFLRTITNSTFYYAEAIKESFDSSSNDVEYQDNDFARQMALVARLIKGNLGTRMYLVTLNGFDTHADQLENHPGQLAVLSNAMRNFYDDLGTTGDNVLGMTFSEFGRRVEQNASNGTDHGSGAPIMLFGAGVDGSGVIGDNPSLTDLDGVGNLKTNYDFRQIYATVLEHWMCIDPSLVDSVLGGTFERIPDMVVDCSPVAGVPTANGLEEIGHRVLYGNGSAMVQYTLSRTTSVDVGIYNLEGRKLSTLYSGTRAAGTYVAALDNLIGRYPAGQYIYAIHTSNGRYSGSLLVH